MTSKDRALTGRAAPMSIANRHHVLGTPLLPPFPEGMERAVFGMGCFWGAERMFWHLPGVYSTSVGYAGGFTPNATYEEVCSGMSGHAEVVQVVFDPSKISYGELLRVFWEGHDPTQGMRQGNDVGTQLGLAGFGTITTQIEPAGDFYYAEDYHQQYLSKNPNGYCGHGGTGVSCPVGLGA
jgi:peptide-methionine (S)-S-oxide reductase